MTYSDILYQRDGGVLTITLNRPDFLNAWTRQMEDDVHAAMTEATRDDQVKSIIITGAGRGFCAGADMNLLGDIQSGEGRAQSHLKAVEAVDNSVPGGASMSKDYGMRYSYFPTVPKPVIAAINGPCAGLGLIMALYCDVRFAADNAAFTTAFSRRGLIAEHGISWMLPALVGHANALDLLMSGRKFMAPEAGQMGLVNRVIDADRLMDETRAYAEDMANNVSPRSMRVMKRQVYNALHQSLEQATLVANSEMPASFNSDDFREGVAHFVEKRPAKFTGN